MKKYIVVEKGSRGEIEDVRYEKSELSLVEFCNSVFKKELNKMEKFIEEDELEEFMEYMEEYRGVSEIEKGIMEICFSEEESWEVCEIVS